MAIQKLGPSEIQRPEITKEGRSLADDIRHYFDIFQRWWWLVILGGLLAVAGAWWQQRGQIDRFTAQVMLQHRSDAPVVPFAGAGRSDVGSQIEIIRSRAVIAPVVDSLGLQFNLRDRQRDWSRIVGAIDVDRDPPRGRYFLVRQGDRLALSRDREGQEVLRKMALGEPIEGPGFTLVLADTNVVRQPISFSLQNWDAAVERLQRRIRAEPTRGSDLIRIGFSDPDPHLAAAVVNAVARSYQAHRAKSARDAASRRRDVIAAQLVELADSLQAVQGLVLNYQQRAQLLNPGAEGNAIMSARLETENEIRQLRYQEGLLETLVAGLRAADSGENLQRIMTMAAELVPSGRSLFDRLQQLETERSRLTASRFGRTAEDPQVQVVDSLMVSVRNQMQMAAEQSLELLRTRLGSAEVRLRELRREAGALPERTAELARYQQRVDAVQDVFDLLVERYYEAQIAEGVEVGDVEVIDPAMPPLRPDPVQDRLYLFVALLVGLFVGGVGALTANQLDTRVRRPRDAEKATGLEVIGKVPLLSSKKSGQLESMLIGKESLRAIRTNLHFATSKPVQVLAVTSAEPSEGKSTIAANLALTFVEQGLSTLLIDADLRRPLGHTLFDVKRAPGLRELLAGTTVLEMAVKTSPVTGKLDVLTAGAPAGNSAELIGSNAFKRIVGQLRGRYDAIVIDTPPLLAVSDAMVVGTVADGTVIVTRADVSSQGALRHAVSQLRRVEAPLVGVILNGVRMKEVSYSYYQAYYREEPRKGKRDNIEERKKKLLVDSPRGTRSAGKKASIGS